MIDFKKIALFISVFLGLALPQIAFAAYQFSSYDFVRNPQRVTNTMRIEMTGRAALRSYRFVGRVGGVNFEGIIDLSNFDIDLNYDPSRTDGQRATATLNGVTYKLPLYDWELEPIVKYADTPHTAVVSIFGEGPNQAKYRYIDYHPAFLDTHLGMRLVQADIILMDPKTFSEVPKSNGSPVYFPGENREIVRDQRLRLSREISSLMAEDYQAWVLTDTDITYSLQDNEEFLRIKTTPYFYFWKSDRSSYDEKIAEYERHRIELKSLAERYEIVSARYNNGQLSALTELEQLRMRLEPGIETLKRLRAELDEFDPEVIEVEALTQRIRSNYDKLHELAPFVFRAVDKTAQYSAFFRGVKENNVNEWKDFRESVTRLIDLPFAETPNQFAR